MNHKLRNATGLVLLGAATFTASALITGPASAGGTTDSVRQINEALLEGVTVPQQLLVLGPNGCVIVDDSGAPVVFGTAQAPARSNSVAADKLTRDKNGDVQATIRPVTASGREDCSLDAASTVERYAAGVGG